MIRFLAVGVLVLLVTGCVRMPLNAYVAPYPAAGQDRTQQLIDSVDCETWAQLHAREVPVAANTAGGAVGGAALGAATGVWRWLQ